VNEKVEVQIESRRFAVVIEELTPIEIITLAQKVSERMAEVRQQNKDTADSSKLALIVALSFAADLDKETRAHQTTRNILENSAEKLSQSLRESLDAGGATEAR
jgi:cell division protein ZapA (FtsZ GTPase activity inhibitor)